MYHVAAELSSSELACNKLGTKEAPQPARDQVLCKNGAWLANIEDMRDSSGISERCLCSSGSDHVMIAASGAVVS